MIAQKGTILIPSGRTSHLHIICSNPVLYPPVGHDCFLCVNISSVPNDVEYDAACVLNVGDHNFVKHESYVYYDRAEIFGVNTVLAKLKEQEFQKHAACSDELFGRVMAGFQTTKFITPKIRRFVEKYC